MSGKTNPRKIPRTEADCKREFARGVTEGVSLSRAILLNVLLDKYGADDWIVDYWQDVIKLSEEVRECRVNLFDLERVLREEYGIECRT